MNTRYSLQASMRWFGPQDPVSLQHLAQAGCTGVVTALHNIAVGEVWPVEAIRERKQQIQAAGMVWEVVESLPVHEDIKRGGHDRDKWLNNYLLSLRNLAECGIQVVTYNFMPLLDWVRTDSRFVLPNGAETLVFRKKEYQMFDLFILQRPGAEQELPAAEVASLRSAYENLGEQDRDRIASTVLLGLPGSAEAFTREQVLEMLETYQHLDRAQLKLNLYDFVRVAAAEAERLGIRLAIHPDDPPFSVLGLPRILCTAEDISDLMHQVPSPANGLCFCTGSLGARADNHLAEIAATWASRIYFFHLRNVKKDDEGNFMEAEHLGGDADMLEIMKIAVQTMQKERRSIPMRPDHGYKMLDDLHKSTYPGYSAIGRLKGLAELRGLEHAVARMLFP